jgi:hypothetical protein
MRFIKGIYFFYIGCDLRRKDRSLRRVACLEPIRTQEFPMPIVAIFQSPTLTRESYEQICRKLTGGKRSRMETASDWPVPGILSHVAGQSSSGFRVIDVWTSGEAFQNFGAVLRPAMQEVGVEGQPEVYDSHAFISTT